MFGEKALESSITYTVKVLSLVMKISQTNIDQIRITLLQVLDYLGVWFACIADGS